MPDLTSLRAATDSFPTHALLKFLIKERFPGKTVVTASLRSSSVVVLKMVADIDPDTPVVFCRRGTPFPESRGFHDSIVSLLGLTNVSVTSGHEPPPDRGDYAHCEQLWVEHQERPGRLREIAHLNSTLMPYDCWISAVYHVHKPGDSRHRVDAEGRLYRVDPLADWSREDVRRFMATHDLPHHERAYRKQKQMPHGDDIPPVETFNV